MAIFDLPMVSLVLSLGVLAGVLTTVAGMGGGLVLLAALGLLFEPHLALAWTAPALLLGNLHRAGLYRHQVDRRSALLLATAAVPAALVAGLLATRLPALVLSAALVGIGALGLLKATGRLRWDPPSWALSPLAAVAGVLTATGGGAGVVMGPLLLARGLSGRPYVATMATVAVALHASRLLAYGLGGLVGPDTVVVGLSLALAIALGNLLGDRLQRLLGARRQHQLAVGALVLCLVLAVGGA